MRSMSAITGIGLQNLLSTFTKIGARYGELNCEQVDEILPNPTTVSRNMQVTAAETRFLLCSDLRMIFEDIGGAITLDIWTDDFKKISYIGVTFHYIADKKSMGGFCVPERLVRSREKLGHIYIWN